jgi:hypothetical protein
LHTSHLQKGPKANEYMLVSVENEKITTNLRFSPFETGFLYENKPPKGLLPFNKIR